MGDTSPLTIEGEISFFKNPNIYTIFADLDIGGIKP
jgi:hypothetical protein